MRKRYVKSVAHWVIMCFILLFPIVMVGISSFSAKQQEINVTETYEYQTNEVTSRDDLINGNIYKLNLDFSLQQDCQIRTDHIFYFHFVSVNDIAYDDIVVSYLSTKQNEYLYLYKNSGSNNFDIQLYADNSFHTVLLRQSYTSVSSLTCYFIYNSNYTSTMSISAISASDYLGEKIIDYTITDQTMRDDVNEWCASFRNLPVNQWYGELLNTIGIGITTSMMMNVIYTYPLYVLWVYIIDLIVDCLLVIINFGHNALKRLGADNE